MSNAILVLDDEKMITDTLSTLIKISLRRPVKAYNDPVQALKSLEDKEAPVDLIITDFMMPGMNGIEFLKNVKKKNPESVRILLTGYADKESAIQSINEVGLDYYLEKPWDNDIMIQAVRNSLEKKELSDSLKERYIELQKSNEEIARLYALLQENYDAEMEKVKSLVVSLANVIEAKDKYTEGHIKRVGAISRKLGEKMNLGSEALDHIEVSGIIHDIGKVGVSELILNKPDKLTQDEFEIMKKHTIIGENICKPLSCFHTCLDAVRHHHEKLDGYGYPDGLKGEQISLEARIIAVADIFDALYSKRPYRDKLPIDKVRATLQDEVSRAHLDAKVVNALFIMLDNKELDAVIEA